MYLILSCPLSIIKRQPLNMHKPAAYNSSNDDFHFKDLTNPLFITRIELFIDRSLINKKSFYITIP